MHLITTYSLSFCSTSLLVHSYLRRVWTTNWSRFSQYTVRSTLSPSG